MKFDFKKFINDKKDASNISLPLEHELHGVKIRKLPNGAYIKALNAVQNLPEILIKGCFPGQDINEVLEYFATMDTDKIIIVAGKLLAIVPEQFLKFLSELLSIPFETLMNELSPNETLQILKAFWEANDLSPFFENLRTMITGSKGIQNLMSAQSKISSLTQSTGSRTGKSSPRSLASVKKHS